MAFEITHLGALGDLPFDQVIDVRSPSEFALDHVPGAINLPVLSDEERARVGTIYVQDSRFRARKIGAALVARNAARHLEEALVDKDGGYRPLVYCWRGGQRSGSFAAILAQVGWRVEVLKGGYLSYRRFVAEALHEADFPAPVIVLGGNTGTAKTDLLLRLRSLGHQVIDLEGLANHRGSLFGARAGGQPSQKAFEGLLALEISKLDPAKPVVVEAESSKVGELYVPPALWRAMCDAPRINLDVPLPERARYLVNAYSDVIEDKQNLRATIDRLRPLHSADQINQWLELVENQAFETLAIGLMQHHYDPRYIKQNFRPERQPGTELAFDDLSPNGLDQAAAQLSEKITEMSHTT